MAAAAALRLAREQCLPIAPISTDFQIQGVDAAYAIAEINTRGLVDAGHRVVGKKVGLTSKAVQQQLGVDQPDFGVLFDHMEYLNGQDVSMSRLMQPKVEAEVAFVMGRDLTSQLPTYAEFLASLAYALPALEIVDSAIADWKRSLVDTVADNASCGHQEWPGGLCRYRCGLSGTSAARGVLAGSYDGGAWTVIACRRGDPVGRAGADGAGGCG